jgi:hypothetical protein
MRWFVVTAFFLTLLPAYAQNAPASMCPSYHWRRVQCQYPNDNPPCFGEISESICGAPNKVQNCGALPGIKCCGHNDPITGQPYLQADYDNCWYALLKSSHETAALRKLRALGREVYVPECQGEAALLPSKQP